MTQNHIFNININYFHNMHTNLGNIDQIILCKILFSGNYNNMFFYGLMTQWLLSFKIKILGQIIFFFF